MLYVGNMCYPLYNDRYQESPPQRPQRSSYSGTPTSDGYYRGQEMGRPVQEYSSPQVGVATGRVYPNTQHM